MRSLTGLLIAISLMFPIAPMAQGPVPSVVYEYFTPLVIRSDRTEPFLYSAKVSGFPSRVGLERGAVEYGMLDDGAGGDLIAGDGIYTVRLSVSQILRPQDPVPEDVFRPFFGFLNVYQGPNSRVFQGNVFLQIITNEIPPAPVMHLGADAQTSPYVFNVVDNSFVTGEVTDVSRITKSFYRYFHDDFDFVNVIYGLSRFQVASHIVVSNDVLGTGFGFVNTAAQYGSGGRLQGITLFPISDSFDGSDPGYQRQLAHQWINHIRRPPLDSGIPQWPISSLASGIMGFSVPGVLQGGDYACLLVPEANGIRLVPRTETPAFKDLDLYLMGLIPLEQVGEHIVFSNQEQAINLPCDNRTTQAATVRVKGSDITNAVGRRTPDWTNAPTRFKVATVFVSKDTLLSQDEMTLFNFFAARAQETKEVPYHTSFVKALAKPFAVSTGGRATLDAKITDIEPFTYTFPPRGAFSRTSQGVPGESPVVGYGRILPDIGNSAPSGFAIFGFRQNGILVTEATVPASPALSAGRFFAEVGGGVDTGLAIVNPNDREVTLTFYFTNEEGDRIKEGSTVIGPHVQISKFLDQEPFNGGASIQGTFTFSASAPVAVTALRGYVNERSEFLITTLPVADLSVTAPTETVLIPHFADGGGWTTQFALVNPTDAGMVGKLEFYSAGGDSSPLSAGAPVEVTIDGRTASSFDYSIPLRSSRRFRTSGGPAVRVGSVRMIPAPGTRVPTAVGIFRYQTGGVTVTEAGVPALQMATAYRVYVETAGNFNASEVGSMQSGVAIANSTSNPVLVQLELRTLGGAPAEFTGTFTVPANGQVAKFLGQIDGFASLPNAFQGVLRVSTSASGLSMVGLRGRYNERREFLITSIQPIVEAAKPPSTSVFFPQIVDGGGYATQFVIMNGAGDVPISASLQFYTQTGANLNLTLR